MGFLRPSDRAHGPSWHAYFKTARLSWNQLVSFVINFFRKPQSWPIVMIPLGLMLWARLAAPALGQASLNSLIFFDSPYRGALPAGRSSEALAEQVVIVVLDGLRVDASQQMSTLNQMRAHGANRVLLVGQPSLSKPGWTVIGTGAWPEQSGIASNFTQATIALDTIFLAANRNGMTTALVGVHGWHQLYPIGVDQDATVPQARLYPATNQAALVNGDRVVTSLALDVLEKKPNLVVVHLLAPDTAAHYWGGMSEPYREVVQNADSQLARILAVLDLSKAALFVIADHGHLDRGGHGGREPIVLRVPLVSVGKGVRAGAYPDAYLADIAPTVAVLLGTSIPAHNQGEALLDQVDASADLKAARAVDLAQQLAARYEAMLRSISEATEIDRETISRAEDALQAGDFAEAHALAEQSNAAVRAQWTAAHNNRLNRDRLARLPLALLLLSPVALYLVWWKRARWNWRAPMIGAAEYFVVWNAAYFGLHGYYFSISMINTEASSLQLLAGTVVDAMFALIAAMLVVGVLSRKAGAGEIVRAAANTLFLVAAALAVQILIFYVAWDVVFITFLPDLKWGFKFYLDVLQTTAFWPTTSLPVAALLPLFALLAAWAANQLGRLIGGGRSTAGAGPLM
jgi:hypothetical protein